MSENSTPYFTRRRLALPVAIGCAIIALGGSGYWYFAYKNALNTQPNRERQELVQRIGSVIELPQEDPEVAEVKDTSKLSNRLLADKTQNGDKLLIYGKAKKVVVYRPASGKVVDLLTIQAAATQESPASPAQ